MMTLIIKRAGALHSAPLSRLCVMFHADESELMKPALYLKVIRSSRAAAVGLIGPIKPIKSFKWKWSQQSPGVVSLATLLAD